MQVMNVVHTAGQQHPSLSQLWQGLGVIERPANFEELQGFLEVGFIPGMRNITAAVYKINFMDRATLKQDVLSKIYTKQKFMFIALSYVFT